MHHPERYPLEWAELARPAVLLGLLAVAAVALTWRAVAVHVGAEP